MNELELYPAIIKWFNQNSKLSLIKELNSGYGIADLVFYELENLEDNDIKPLLTEKCYLHILKLLLKLSEISKNKISLTTVSDALPRSNRDTQKIISYLIDKDYIQIIGDEILINKKYRVGIKSAIAVEAKLENWKRGLYQAYRYKTFANQSYLALQSNHIHNALKNLDQFVAREVGLLEVRGEEIILHYDPEPRMIEENLYSAIAYQNILIQKDIDPPF